MGVTATERPYPVTQTILLIGATGMLGGRITHYLLEQPDVRVRLLVRDIAGKRAGARFVGSRGGPN